MTVVTWDEYYEKFYDWAESTQKSKISSITDFGASDEICEIALEFYDEKAAQRLVKRALAAGVRFTSEEITELSMIMDKDTLSKMVDTSVSAFNKDQLDELYLSVYDDVFERASKRSKIDIFSDDEADCDSFSSVNERHNKSGFFTTLFALFGANNNAGFAEAHKHNGKCNGNCAECPPHYGYRYGRWYYGHNHNHGCEFGGNKGL